MDDLRLDTEFTQKEQEFCKKLVDFLNEQNIEAPIMISAISRILGKNSMLLPSPSSAILAFIKVLIDDYYVELMKEKEPKDA